MSNLTLARLFAMPGSIVALAGTHPFQRRLSSEELLPIALWAGGLMPLAYWVGKRLVKSPRAAKVLTAGLGLALGLGLFGFWDVLFGSGREESLAGLIVIVMPVSQFAVLAVTLILVWLA